MRFKNKNHVYFLHYWGGKKHCVFRGFGKSSYHLMFFAITEKTNDLQMTPNKTERGESSRCPALKNSNDMDKDDENLWSVSAIRSYGYPNFNDD